MLKILFRRRCSRLSLDFPNSEMETASDHGFWAFVANLGRSRLRMSREGYTQDWLGGRLIPECTKESEPSSEVIFHQRIALTYPNGDRPTAD